MNILNNKFFWVIASSIAIPTLIMLQVLIWPHYGLFSDADQLIEFPKFLFDNPSAGFDRILRPFGDGRYQPLFYLLTILIYSLRPDSSLVFYIFQWIIFIAISYAIGSVIFRITQSKWFSIFGILLFSLSSSIFENFYTLDKIEPRSTFFSAMILLTLVSNLLSKDLTLKRFPLFFWLAQIIFGIFLVFSKETGIFIFFSFVLTLIACLLSSQVNLNLKKVVLISVIIQGIIVIAFYVLYKSLWNPDNDGRYLNYTVTPELVHANFMYYLKSSPEAMLGIICALYVFYDFFKNRKITSFTQTKGVIFFTSSALVVYFSGILIWRWPLDYFLLPVHFFSAVLIPLVLFHPITIFFKKNRKLTYIFLILIFLLFGKYIGERIINGFLIYQQDELKDDLVSLLAEPKWLNKRFVLVFNHPNSAEIGERIKFFSDRVRPVETPINLFNFWEVDDQVITSLNRFEGAVGNSPKYSQLYDAQQSYMQNKGTVIIWKLGKGANPDPSLPWGYSTLRSGDVLIVPYSTNMPNWTRARGLGMYSSSFHPPNGITAKESGVIGRKFGPWFIGWKIFVIENPTVSQVK